MDKVKKKYWTIRASLSNYSQLISLVNTKEITITNQIVHYWVPEQF